MVKGHFRSRNAIASVKRAGRMQKAVQLRIEGKTYTEIGQILGVVQSKAWQLVKDALEITQEDIKKNIETYRKIEVARLDALQAHWWPKAVGLTPDGELTMPNIKASQHVLKIIAERAKILGLVKSDPLLINSENTNTQNNVIVWSFPLSDKDLNGGVIYEGSRDKLPTRLFEGEAVSETRRSDI
jgi:hypothetical protein